jgi:hypothetical protein
MDEISRTGAMDGELVGTRHPTGVGLPRVAKGTTGVTPQGTFASPALFE